jgi:Tol biopolymer transport system component
MIGKTISHYQITLKLGEGGMGEVFQAQDISLDRMVALKFLPDKFVDDRERLARFKREAKLLASLSHPNIAAIHGLEQSDNKNFLVLELVEGETLAQRIFGGPLPTDEALEVCRQIAEGLEAAHEKGIVHRDLKPSNVKITPEGKVKVLDFGLARALQDQPLAANLSNSPTIPDDVTIPGMILGTAAYMSPEQAKGKAVDKRTDIWAFGCVLYECLTGKRAFQGETITEIMASILKSEPDWSALPGDISPPIRKLLHRCLQKDPSLRLRDIGDARIELTEPVSQPSETVSEPRRIPLPWLAAGAAVLLVACIIAGLGFIGYFQQAPTVSTVKSIIGVDPASWRLEVSRNAMVVASDGRFIVYGARPMNPGPQAKPQIYLRRMDRMNADPVAGTEGGGNPFLSPDDRWIGFWDGAKLKKAPVTGGVPATLCDAPVLFGADWGSDNTIVFSADLDVGISRISGEGGQPEILTTPDRTKEEYSHRLPHFLPDGKSVLFTVMEAPWSLDPRLALLDLQTRKWREVLKDAADGRYLSTGHLVFLREGTLMAVAFDLNRLEVKGQPVPVVEHVMQALNLGNVNMNTAAGQYGVSNSGWLAYVPARIQSSIENSLVHVDLKGNIRPAVDFKGPFPYARFSPDGRRIAYGRERQLWVYDFTRGAASRLTGDGQVTNAEWTPDGKSLVLAWGKTGLDNLYLLAADGSSSMERLTESSYEQAPGCISPDGSTLAFIEVHSQTESSILLLDMKTHRVTPFLDQKVWAGWPVISPDGRWLAYTSTESGSIEVWVRPFPGKGGKWQISNDQGQEPIWSKDGKQLFYRRVNQVWVADIKTEGGFSPGKPRLLFEPRGMAMNNPLRHWDLEPDGQGFLMVQTVETKPQPVKEIVLVQNWFEELKRLVPVK